MKVYKSDKTQFCGIKLKNPSYEHAKYVKRALENEGVCVLGHKSYKTLNKFEAKRNITEYVRSRHNFIDKECGIIFFPWANESWIIGKKSYEQKVYKILNNLQIDSEINLVI